eukprot:TRINITY_DN12910_c0_g1_i4.p1 TRINITY_DN12910_c0_g1~~TRINITY_DN12910_c0_g1_i4.p1  ORF type:complete len:208 (-),score=18.91 TRINITY_DN12910_c0_g1_i4:17-640(-)
MSWCLSDSWHKPTGFVPQHPQPQPFPSYPSPAAYTHPGSHSAAPTHPHGLAHSPHNGHQAHPFELQASSTSHHATSSTPTKLPEHPSVPSLNFTSPAPAGTPLVSDDTATIGVEVQFANDGQGGKENLVVVHGIAPHSPAEEAGLQNGDVLMRWDGELLDGRRSFASCLARGKVGSTVTLDVFRNGQRLRLPVRVAAKRRGAVIAGN